MRCHRARCDKVGETGVLIRGGGGGVRVHQRLRSEASRALRHNLYRPPGPRAREGNEC